MSHKKHIFDGFLIIFSPLLSGIVMHELMHAAGFWHEQSRADRDEFISIQWDNIKSGMEFNFLKYDLRKIDHLGAEYDTCSVMHYGAYAFAKVGPVTDSKIQKTRRYRILEIFMDNRLPPALSSTILF